jgi:uncharacterized protein YraI
MNHRNWILTGLLLVAVLLALVGPASANPTQAQDLMARLRFLHAVPGAPEVDVYLDGAVVASGLAFGQVTPHLKVAGGDHKVTLRQAGTDANSPAVVEVNVPVSPSLAYTLVAQGKPGAFQAALYEDVLDEIGVGMARLTAINAIADAPPLDVLTREGSPLLQGVNYGSQFGTININSGVQDLVMVPAGGAVDSAIVDIGPVPLESGTLYTLVALGQIEGGTAPSALVVATPVNGTAGSVLVRFADGSPDAPAVDVYANDTLLVPSLTLGQMSGHMALPAGDYTVALRPAGAAAADAPIASASVKLDSGTPALTVAAVGEVSDTTLALQTFPDNIAGMTPDKARIAIINAVPGATVTVKLSDPSGTVLASDLNANAQGSPVDVSAGEYMLTASVQGVTNPVDLLVPGDMYGGGIYYSVLVFGGGPNDVPYDADVAGTEIDVTVDSLPKPTPAAMAANPTPLPTGVPPTEAAVAVQPTPLPTEVPPTPLPPQPAAPTQTELVTQPAGQSELVGQPTEAAPAPTQQPLVPQGQQPIAYVELNPDANLQCRELPGADKKSLGLIPSGTTLTVLGRTGTPLVPETGNATPEPTPTVEAIEDLWLSVRWDPPGGGYMRCWVSAQFLRVEFKGKLLDTLDELMALPEVPFNQPGESVGTTITPPTPLFDAVIATVELQPGVSLQLRRNPKTDAESLGLVPAGAQLEVLGYAEVPSEGLVGQPTSPYWLYVRYRTENGGATIGWVSAEYVSLSKLGHKVEITDLVVVDANEAGYFEAPGQAPVIPLEQQKVVGVVNLNAGANLNLRDRPSSDARVVVGIPSGESMILNGRNGDGTWVQVTYASAAGDLDGWVAAQYLIITRGGQPYDIKQLPILTGEPDTMGG